MVTKQKNTWGASAGGRAEAPTAISARQSFYGNLELTADLTENSWESIERHFQALKELTHKPVPNHAAE